MTFRYYVKKVDLEKAATIFKNFNEFDFSENEKTSFFQIAVEFYYRTSQFGKSLFYINKLLKSDTRPLEKIPLVFAKSLIEVLDKNGPFDATEENKQFYEFAKVLESYKIDDPELVAMVKLGQEITENTPSIKKIENAIQEFKKYQYQYDFLPNLTDQAYAIFSKGLSRKK